MILLSLGENSLIGNVLNRFGVKNTWDTPYTYARSNIKYAIKCEEDNYVNLLNKKYIQKCSEYYFPEIYRNLWFAPLSNDIFSWEVSYGFEFTDWDPNDLKSGYYKYKLSIGRMLDLRENGDDICFFYYYRNSDKNDLDALETYLKRFNSFYSNRDRTCKLVVIVQKLVNNKKERRVEVVSRDGFFVCTFYCLYYWRGNNPAIVSAEIDDDLFIKMFKGLFKEKVLDNIDFVRSYYETSSVRMYYERNFSLKSYINELLKKDNNDLLGII